MGLSLCWGIYFLEHLAKDKNSLPIYQNKNALEKFFINSEIAQRDYAHVIHTSTGNGMDELARILNKQDEMIKRTPSYTLHYQCIDAENVISIANSMLKNEARSQHQALIFGMRLEKEINDKARLVNHAVTLGNDGNGCVFFEANGGIYKLDKNKNYSVKDLIIRTINNISCLRDSDRSNNQYLISGSKNHLLITLKSNQFNTQLREDQENKGFKNAAFKIPRSKYS